MSRALARVLNRAINPTFHVVYIMPELDIDNPMHTLLHMLNKMSPENFSQSHRNRITDLPRLSIQVSVKNEIFRKGLQTCGLSHTDGTVLFRMPESAI
jgi:hypothetical protein